MFKFFAFAAVAASALLASSANASDLLQNPAAAPTVRVSVTGKTVGQIREEIRVAARTVCQGEDSDCVDKATAGAERQLNAMRGLIQGDVADAAIERLARN